MMLWLETFLLEPMHYKLAVLGLKEAGIYEAGANHERRFSVLL